MILVVLQKFVIGVTYSAYFVNGKKDVLKWNEESEMKKYVYLRKTENGL